MKLKAVIPEDNNEYQVIERTLSLEPHKLIIHLNYFSETVNQSLKDKILETIALTGKAPTRISVRVFENFHIMDFSKEMQLEMKDGVIRKIDQILYELCTEMRKELIFEIVCSSDFRNQKIRPDSKKNLGGLR